MIRSGLAGRLTIPLRPSTCRGQPKLVGSTIPRTFSNDCVSISRRRVASDGAVGRTAGVDVGMAAGVDVGKAGSVLAGEAVGTSTGAAVGVVPVAAGICSPDEHADNAMATTTVATTAR